MSETNKATARRYFTEVHGRHDLDVCDEIFHPDFVLIDPLVDEPIRGPEGMKALLEAYWLGLPDVVAELHEQIAEGDKVVSHYTTRGTHTGDMLGIPATGKRYELRGVLISRLVDGKIIEEQDYRDDLGMLRQIGVVTL